MGRARSTDTAYLWVPNCPGCGEESIASSRYAAAELWSDLWADRAATWIFSNTSEEGVNVYNVFIVADEVSWLDRSCEIVCIAGWMERMGLWPLIQALSKPCGHRCWTLGGTICTSISSRISSWEEPGGRRVSHDGRMARGNYDMEGF